MGYISTLPGGGVEHPTNNADTLKIESVEMDTNFATTSPYLL